MVLPLSGINETVQALVATFPTLEREQVEIGEDPDGEVDQNVTDPVGIAVVGGAPATSAAHAVGVILPAVVRQR